MSTSKLRTATKKKIEIPTVHVTHKPGTTSDVLVLEDPAPVKKSVKTKISGSDGFVTLGGYFKVPKGTYEILKRNICKGVNTLLLGPTGHGKTELVLNMAEHLKIPVTVFDMGTMSDPIMSLVGTHTIKVKDGHTQSQFIPSRFSEVIQKPGIVVLDELSRANALANNLLFPVLDSRKELAMEYSFDNTASVKVHPECVFMATANLGSQYTGTHKIDRALLDRFMLLEVDALNAQQTQEVIQLHTPAVSNDDIQTIVRCYSSINKAHDDYTISFNLSIRHLKMIAELVQDGFTIYDSFYSICRGIGSKEGLKALEPILSDFK